MLTDRRAGNTRVSRQGIYATRSAGKLLRETSTLRIGQRDDVARDFGQMGDVVDLEGYTESCLGLTGCTTGYDVAQRNYLKNMVQPWTDLHVDEEQVVVGPDTVVVRSHTIATHTGEFPGHSGHRSTDRVDAVTMVQVKDGRVVGQWAQPDLFNVYRQISGHKLTGVASVDAPSRRAPAWATSAAPA